MNRLATRDTGELSCPSRSPYACNELIPDQTTIALNTSNA